MKIISQPTSKSHEKSTSEFTRIMHEVLDLARKKGATDAAVAIDQNSGFSVDVRMRQVETVAFSEDRGVGVTVYIGKRKGSASSSDVSPAALEAMVTAAVDIARVSAKIPVLACRSLIWSLRPILNWIYTIPGILLRRRQLTRHCCVKAWHLILTGALSTRTV